MKRKRVLTRMKSITVHLMLLVGAIVVLCGRPTIVSAAEFKVPKTISIMTFELGSSGYMAFGFVGEYMLKTYGTQLRAIPAGNDTARMIALRSGMTQFSAQGLDAHYAMEGITPRYSTSSWGPQDELRLVFMGQHAGQAFVVRGNSKISSIADLKGKKLAWIPGSALNELAAGHLAYAGLTWDDVKKVNMPGFVPSIKGVLDGSVDTAISMVTSSVNYEIEASPYGIRWLPLSDKEGIARLQKKVSDLVPYRATVGAGLSKSKPLDCMTYTYPATVCYASLDEDVAYFMTKAIIEGYDTMAAASKIIKNYWKLDSFLYLYESYDFAILHPGTVRYLKEIGKWKPIYDKFQKERPKKFKKLRALWEKVTDEAIEKKIKAKDFPKFWLGKRAAFLGE